MKRVTNLLLTAVSVALASTAMASTTCYVNGVSGSDTNNCTSTTTACKTTGLAIFWFLAIGFLLLAQALVWAKTVTATVPVATDNVYVTNAISDLLNERSQINLSSSAAANSCLALGVECTSSSQCCNDWCGQEVRRCCLSPYNMYCTASSQCCRGACVNNRCQ